MSRILNRRPSPAMVVALIALFVAMGGVSYGVATGSIDGREIKNSTIKTGDLRNNDIRGTDIRRGTITGSDVGSNALSGADISESSLGKVASASRADSATTANSAGTANTANSANTANTANTANSANTVNGLRTEKFFFKGAASTGLAPRYSSNGFVLNAGCICRRRPRSSRSAVPTPISRSCFGPGRQRVSRVSRLEQRFRQCRT